MLSKKIAKPAIAILLIVALSAITFFACHRETGGTKTEGIETDGSKTVETTEYESPTITVERVEAHPGDEVKVPVRFMQSPGIAACRLIVEYDNESLELKSVSYGGAFAENGEEPAKLTGPVPLTWSQLENITGDELFAELTFKVKKDAEVHNVYPVTVRHAAGDLVDIDEKEVDFAIENGSIEIIK